MTEQQIIDILSALEDPRTKKKVSEITKIEGISTAAGLLKIRLSITDLQPDEKTLLRKLIEGAFTERNIDVLVSITSQSTIQPKPISPNSAIKPFIPEEILKKFKKIIAVYSNKGGVGKSTISAQLARDFTQQGLKTAIIDLDIYGPSIPRILGMKEKVKTQDQKFIPSERDGIHMMSIGLLIPSIDSPLIWRAPIVNGVIAQMFTDTLWDDAYDVLILDLPPGTGDIPILVGQNIPPTGILVVSTPQGIALEDTIKGLVMFQKFNIPILGFVYNMGSVICPDCDKAIRMFTINQEFDELMMDYELSVLAELPMDPRVAESADKGQLEGINQQGIWKKEFSKITDSLLTQLDLKRLK